MKPTAKIRPLLAGSRCDSSNCPARQWAALLDRSLAEASREAGIALTPCFVIDDAVRLWRLRVSQIAADPGSARWVARAVVAEPEGVVAGHAGFHGPSDHTGMVEVPYSADPAYRRRGYARAMLRELLRHAAAKPGVSTVRATISPGNVRPWPRSRASALPRLVNNGTRRTAASSSSKSPADITR
jgi:[ribosomal protein S5]-alanine N-acetyltransferase